MPIVKYFKRTINIFCVFCFYARTSSTVVYKYGYKNVE